MRIITGIAKGRRILAPEGIETRPTSDRVKEALFNIIQYKIDGSIILDLFAGTGNLGLEAVSRGAQRCVFIEHNRNTYKILLRNIEYLGFNGKSEAYNQDAFTALKILARREEKYDIIFLDPPYGKGYIEKAIELISHFDLLSDEGIIASEHDKTDELPEKVGLLKVYRSERYGRTKITFWNKEEYNG